jgi:hypothetical protein
VNKGATMLLPAKWRTRGTESVLWHSWRSRRSRKTLVAGAAASDDWLASPVTIVERPGAVARKSRIASEVGGAELDEPEEAEGEEHNPRENGAYAGTVRRQTEE